MSAAAHGTPLPDAARRAEVWGDPIDHSLSPRLHAAAYAELALPWAYGRRRVTAAGFADELDAIGSDVRGLSLTYPLKTEAYRAATARDRFAELTGAVNTLLLVGADRRGFNTDVGGIVADLRDLGIDGVDRARIIGAGATATSALVALAELGAERVDVVARRPEAAAPLVLLGERIGVAVQASPLDAVRAGERVPVSVSTLPGGASLPPGAAAVLAADGGMLYDVVYGHWPTELATAWADAGGVAYNGLGMLLRQAVGQVRIFTTGDPDAVLPGEGVVVDVMRRALMGD